MPFAIALIAGLALAQQTTPASPLAIHAAFVEAEREAIDVGRVDIHVFSRFGMQDAVPFIRETRKLRNAAAFQSAANWLVKNGGKPGISVLVDSLGWRFSGWAGSTPPAYNLFYRLGWNAVDPLIAGLRSGDRPIRVYSMELLASQAHDRPIDGRLKPIFNRFLAQSDDWEVRGSAVTGLWNIAFDPHIWSMDGIYELKTRDEDALRGVIDASMDADQRVIAASLGNLTRLLWTHNRDIFENTRGRADPTGLEVSQPRIRRFLTDPDPVVRCAALVLVNARLGLDRERFAAMSDPDPLVRHAAIVTSTCQVPHGWIPNLVGLLKSPFAQTRDGAARLLRATHDPTAIGALKMLANQHRPAR